MKIGFVSSEKYPETIHRLADTEFPYIDILYLTYEDYTKVPRILEERQLECDAILFSGYLAYYYSRANCPQKIPWMVVQSQSSSLASALRTAIEQGYDIHSLCICSLREHDFQSACREIGVDPQKVTLYQTFPSPNDYAEPDYNQKVYRFYRRHLDDRNVSCCITSNLYAFRRLTSEGVPIIFMETSFDTFRQAFYSVYRQLIDPSNQQAQIVAVLVENDLPGDYSAVTRSEYQYMRRRLRVLEKIYAFANRLQGITSDAGFNQQMIVCTRNEFEAETKGFREFDLFREINRDIMGSCRFGVGYGITAIAAKQNACIALEHARVHGPNSACLVAASGKTVSLISYLDQPEKGLSGADGKLEALSKKSGISAKRLARLCEIIDDRKTRRFTSTELAALLGVSKRNMDRILLRLESACMARVVGKMTGGEAGRPKRIFELNFSV